MHALAVLSLLLSPELDRGPSSNGAADADVETVLNNLESPIELREVAAAVESADGASMQVDYDIPLGHVVIAARIGEDGAGVARLTLDRRVLVEQEFVGAEVVEESTAFGDLTGEEVHLLAASVYQVWDHDVVLEVLTATDRFLCEVAAGLSGLAIAAGVIAGCEWGTAGLGTPACVGLGTQVGAQTGAIVHKKCGSAQN
ncbi:hypothetical protein OV203_04795 [Nannocystis sp. ILAH1]|uniref:hypothetical protein n=1 Tax=unclassified Nannocystis TaxID=2627009 RepID=UPI0022713461|nr:MULTISPECIES: hypothetical protein [unclassified Nannocystis]MCY0986423.1 hypothetical protein [Nannocystis sp. ILAH1]MCY1071305.1 hypothetical protein [Nannocystis sp. RBIL2]